MKDQERVLSRFEYFFSVVVFYCCCIFFLVNRSNLALLHLFRGLFYYLFLLDYYMIFYYGKICAYCYNCSDIYFAYLVNKLCELQVSTFIVRLSNNFDPRCLFVSVLRTARWCEVLTVAFLFLRIIFLINFFCDNVSAFTLSRQHAL